MNNKYPQLSTQLIFTDLDGALVAKLYLLGVKTVQGLMKYVYGNYYDINLDEEDLDKIHDFFRRHFHEVTQESPANPYHFRIINNHIIIDIPSQGEYLLDTGSTLSLTFDVHHTGVEIDSVTYPLTYIPRFDLNQIYQLIGIEVKGFIGLDILSKTSFSFEKRDESGGDFYFSPLNYLGEKHPISYQGYVTFKTKINGIDATYLVDTGAKIPYVEKNFFIAGSRSTKQVKDYNPNLGQLCSNVYECELFIKKPYKFEAAYNNKVEEYALHKFGVDAIGSILNFVNKSASFDLKNLTMELN